MTAGSGQVSARSGCGERVTPMGCAPRTGPVSLVPALLPRVIAICRTISNTQLFPDSDTGKLLQTPMRYVHKEYDVLNTSS